MTNVPYAPTPFDTPVINPSVGGFGVAVPYVSVSGYAFAPTAMDTSNLVEGASPPENVMALYNTIRRASRWADRYCFGVDPAAKGASLCATQSVEHARIKILQQEMRLICSYKPIIEVDGIDVGFDPSTTVPIDSSIVPMVRIGERTIYVPYQAIATTVGGLSDTASLGFGWSGQRGYRYAVWSYVNGYPHTMLSSSASEGSSIVEVVPTSAAGGLYGIYPGTQLTIEDGSSTEAIVVQSLAGSTITTVSSLEFDHTIDDETPDFIAVTALPEDVGQAVIFLTTALIKTRGDNSLVLDDIEEPEKMQSTADGVSNDIATAFEMLDPFRVATKVKA